MEKRGVIIGIIVIAVIVLFVVLFIPSGKEGLGETEREQDSSINFVTQQEPFSPPPIPEPIPTSNAEEITPSEFEIKEFIMTAKRFEYNPSTITVNQGDRVRLKITSIDVSHGFRISEYDINERLNPNEEVVIEFTADKTGTFSYYCNVFCGSGHGGMRGTLIVN